MLYIRAIWIAVGIFWLAGSIRGKRATRVEPAGSRWLHLIIMTIAFALLFTTELRIGWLGSRFVPDAAGVVYAGVALTLVGAAFAVWARLLLGRNWSAVVTVKHDHELIRRGPYAVVRHPIYSGFLLAMLGTAIALGEVRGLIALAVALIGWRMKSLVEERFMTEEFGEEYVKYKREVKALIPFVL